MFRLLFVTHSFPPPDRPLASVGGMQRVATELHHALEQLPDLHLESQILYSSWERVHQRVPYFLLKTVGRLNQIARSKSVDAVLFSSMVTASLTTVRKKKLRRAGIKTAAIVHGQDVTTPFGPYQQFVPHVFSSIDAILPVSRATGEQCLERGLLPEKLHVVPNGVRLERFTPLINRIHMKRELLNTFSRQEVPFSENGLLLCSVGRQVKRKGFSWFIRHVMPRLPNNVHYWLAGDGPETETIQQSAKEAGVAHRVRLLGRVTDDELALLYRGADLFMMPNIPVPGTMEGFGVVLLECGLNGMPAIAARLEGIQDVINEDQNGHFVESGDADGFMEFVLKYYNDRPALKELSRRAAKYTRDTFSWEAVARQYVDVLKGLPQKTTGAAEHRL